MLRMLCGSLVIVALGAGSRVADDANKAAQPEKKNTPQERARRPSDVVFILIETSDDGNDSLAELQLMYDVLRKLDKNNTGKIDAQQLKAARQQIFEERADRIIQKLDANKDGKISKQEAKGRILEHFDRIDTNKDGFIDRNELIQAITGHAQAGKGAPADKKAPDRSPERK